MNQKIVNNLSTVVDRYNLKLFVLKTIGRNPVNREQSFQITTEQNGKLNSNVNVN